MVTSVDNKSAAFSSGLRAGDIVKKVKDVL